MLFQLTMTKIFSQLNKFCIINICPLKTEYHEKKLGTLIDLINHVRKDFERSGLRASA